MTEKTSLLASAAARAIVGAPMGAQLMLRGPQVTFAPLEEGGSSGGLSIEAAVAHLNEQDGDDAGAGDEDAGDSAGGGEQDQSGAASADDDAGDGAENPDPDEADAGDGDGEAEELDPAAVAPAEAPKYWSQEAKARFAQLPPELQAVVLQQEGPREAATAKAKADAQQVREKADKDIADAQKLATGLTEFLPQAIETFRSRWGDKEPDWVAYAQEHGADRMSVAKARFEQQRDLLTRTAQAAQEAGAVAHRAFLEQESVKLAELAPDLADPKEGPARRRAVGQYLVDSGIPQDALANISAAELTLAHKAMLWDQAQAKAKTPTPKPALGKPAAKPALTRGGAAAGPVDPKARQAQKAKNRFAQTRSIADAAAYLDSIGD